MPYKIVQLARKPKEKDYWRFVDERQRIWHRRFKKKQKPPWTKDPILANYHFCNIYRELDAGTIWIINKLGDCYFAKDQLFLAVAYRCLNLPSTFNAVGITPNKLNWKRFVRSVRKLEKLGEPVFSSAYRASAFGPRKRLDIYRAILEAAAGNLNELTKRMQSVATLREACKTVESIWGIGDFIAWQVINDLLYTAFFPQGFTENDWTVIGPGAAYGLENFWGVKGKQAQLVHCEYLRTRQVEQLPRDFSWLYRKGDITLANIQFSLCEFRKYCLLREGEGKPRRYRISN